MPRRRLPPAAAARRSAAATSSPPFIPSSPGAWGARAPTGRPSRTASRGRAAGRVTAFFTVVTTVFRCAFGLCLGFGFGAARGEVNVERAAGLVARTVLPALARGEVEVLLVDDADAAPGEGSGAGSATCFAGGAFDAVADAAVIGASGAGTACAASATTRFALGDVGVVVLPAVLTVDARYVGGGSSGAGIGVPPAAQPFPGQANATRQNPAPTTPPLSRRDDVHVGTTSLPFEPHRTSGDILVSIDAWERPPCVPAAAPVPIISACCLLLPSLDRAAPGASALVVPRALAGDLQCIRALARLLLHQCLAGLVEVERHGERRDVVRLLDRPAAARASDPEGAFSFDAPFWIAAAPASASCWLHAPWPATCR